MGRPGWRDLSTPGKWLSLHASPLSLYLFLGVSPTYEMSVRWQVAPVFRRLDSAVNNKSVVHRGVSTAGFSVVFRHSHNSGKARQTALTNTSIWSQWSSATQQLVSINQLTETETLYGIFRLCLEVCFLHMVPNISVTNPLRKVSYPGKLFKVNHQLRDGRGGNPGTRAPYSPPQTRSRWQR